MSRTMRELLWEGTALLEAAGIVDFKTDAWYLLSDTCHIRRVDYLIAPDASVSEADAAAYMERIRQRRGGCPLQYITGVQEFMGIPFMVNEHVLIPRLDTEVLVENVLKYLPEDARILDMCTGSGCILLSIMAMKLTASGEGVDLSEDALAVAAENERRIRAMDRFDGLSAGGPAVRWIKSDLFEALDGRIYDVIVSNPPYIPTEQIPTLMTEVRSHEPLMALDGSGDGMLFYRRISSEARDHLSDNGMIFFEIGWDQAEAVCGLLRQAGFRQIEVRQDLAGLDRVVMASKN